MTPTDPPLLPTAPFPSDSFTPPNISTSPTTPTPSSVPAAEEALHAFFDQLQEQRHTIPNVLDVTVQRMRRYHRLSAEAGEQCLAWLIDHRLIPYFSEYLHCVEWELTSKKGRVQWLANLLNTRSGPIMMREAVIACGFTPTASRSSQSTSRPSQSKHADLPPHAGPSDRPQWKPPEPTPDIPEYRDPVTGARLYRDPDEGIFLPLPPDAPPRPSITARWHPLRHEWL